MLKTVLIVAAGSLVGSVAQADNFNSAVLLGTDGASYNLQSMDTPTTGGYDYFYNLYFQGGGPAGLNSFTVNALDTTGFLNVLNPANWNTGGIVVGGYTWSYTLSIPPSDASSVLSFELFSPDGPGTGTAFAEDSVQFSDTGVNNVTVPTPPTPPSVPDSGLTVGLLGGAFLGLSVLRRKLGF